MKLLLILTLTLGCTLANAQAFASPTRAAVKNGIQSFGLPESILFEGRDEKGTSCRISSGLEDTYLSVTASKFPDGGQLDASFYLGFDRKEYQVLSLDAQGSVAEGGTFKTTVRERVEAHKTDFGLWIAPYYVDFALEITYRDGKVISASVKVSRPGASKLVIDPAFQGSQEVKNCAIAGDRHLVATCIAPLFEGELQIYMDMETRAYSVNLSGMHDFPTKEISAGPTGLYLEFTDMDDVKKILQVEPRSKGQDVEGKATLASDPNTVLNRFKCSYQSR